MTYRPSVAPADYKRQRQGEPSTDHVVLWVRFLVGAGFSHTKDSTARHRGGVGWGLLTELPGGNPALTKRFYGFDSQLELGWCWFQIIPKTIKML